MDIAVEFTIHMTRWWLLSIPGGFMIPCGWMASDFWGHMGLVKIGESTWMIWNSWLDSRSSTFLDSSCTRNGVIKRGNSVNGGRQRAQWFWTHSMIRPIIKKQNIEKTWKNTMKSQQNPIRMPHLHSWGTSTSQAMPGQLECCRATHGGRDAPSDGIWRCEAWCECSWYI